MPKVAAKKTMEELSTFLYAEFTPLARAYVSIYADTHSWSLTRWKVAECPACPRLSAPACLTNSRGGKRTTEDVGNKERVSEVYATVGAKKQKTSFLMLSDLREAILLTRTNLSLPREVHYCGVKRSKFG